jgi:AraC-like DNA-binding protein
MRISIPAADIQIMGKRTRYLAVCGREDEGREWLVDAPRCKMLGDHHISHTGIMNAEAPYEVFRLNQSGTFMMACLAGEGVVMVDGGWKTIRSGQACLLPPFVMNSLKCVEKKPWRFAWVRYEESREFKPIVSSLSPVIGCFDGRALESTIEGLHHEAGSEGQAAALHHWSNLVNHYVMKFAEPAGLDERLWRLWTKVGQQPERDWTLPELSEIACLSGEHLRRLCHAEIGRSPMKHLTFIRLQKAIEMISSSDEKIETIAKAVGFSGIHSLSNAFKSWFGKRPSDFR